MIRPLGTCFPRPVARLRKLGGVSENNTTLTALLIDEPLLSLAEVAERFHLPVTKVGDLLNTRKLVAVRAGGKKLIPAALIGDQDSPSKFVTGAITVLFDGGYDDVEILEYLFTEDDTLPGRPVDVLHSPRAREVIRRAQAMAF